MSSSNGTEYYLKSMNGIKSFDDGSGTIIEDDSITIATIECTGNTTAGDKQNLPDLPPKLKMLRLLNEKGF